MPTLPPAPDGDLPAVVRLARDLVRIPGPSGQEGPVSDFVARTLAFRGFEVHVDAWGGVTGVRRGPRPGPTLLLDAHLDTVTVPDADAWSHGPHDGDVADGRLWGRGAVDTRGSLAAMMMAAAEAALPSGTVVVSASVGEEDLTALALGPVLDRHAPDVVVVGEPTLLRLGVAQKGRAGVRLRARGRTAHSSRPDLGVNAVYRMMDAVSRLRTLPLRDDPDLGPEVLEVIEMASEPRPSPGMVPHACEARLALRLLPGDAASALLARLRAALDGLAGVDVDLVLCRDEIPGGVETRKPVRSGIVRATPATPWRPHGNLPARSQPF